MKIYGEQEKVFECLKDEHYSLPEQSNETHVILKLFSFLLSK